MFSDVQDGKIFSDFYAGTIFRKFQTSKSESLITQK